MEIRGDGFAFGGDIAAESIHHAKTVNAFGAVGEAVEVEVAALAGVWIVLDDRQAKRLGLLEQLSGAAGFSGFVPVVDGDDGIGSFEHLDVCLGIAIGGNVAAAGDANGRAAGAGMGGIDEDLGSSPIVWFALEVLCEECFGFGEDNVDGEVEFFGDFASNGI